MPELPKKSPKTKAQKLFEKQKRKSERRAFIEAWLEKYKIKNHAIHDDLTVSVYGNVELSDRHLKFLPFRFRHIEGNFYITNNELKSLKNSPLSVSGNFSCGGNALTTLEFAPKKVGSFSFSNNKVRSFNFCPDTEGEIVCRHNKLTSLSGLPKKITALDFSFNKVKSFDGISAHIERGLIAQNNNLENINNLPHYVGSTILLKDNPKLGDLQNITSFEELRIVVEKKKFDKSIPAITKEYKESKVILKNKASINRTDNGIDTQNSKNTEFNLDKNKKFKI